MKMQAEQPPRPSEFRHIREEQRQAHYNSRFQPLKYYKEKHIGNGLTAIFFFGPIGHLYTGGLSDGIAWFLFYFAYSLFIGLIYPILWPAIIPLSMWYGYKSMVKENRERRQHNELVLARVNGRF